MEKKKGKTRGAGKKVDKMPVGGAEEMVWIFTDGSASERGVGWGFVAVVDGMEVAAKHGPVVIGGWRPERQMTGRAIEKRHGKFQ